MDFGVLTARREKNGISDMSFPSLWETTKIVVPTSLQMGWIESPPFFCAASEMCRDDAAQYTETPVGLLPTHKFTRYTTTGEDCKKLPQNKERNGVGYVLEVYDDDYIALAMPTL